MAWERRRDDPANRANAERQPRARKDRKRWCRGKPGVKHQPSLVASRDGWPCHPPEAWHRQMWPGEDWVCWHREECTACGRVLRTGVAPECPDRRPRPEIPKPQRGQLCQPEGTPEHPDARWHTFRGPIEAGVTRCMCGATIADESLVKVGEPCPCPPGCRCGAAQRLP